MVVLRFTVDDEPPFLAAAHEALEALAARPGYRSGQLGRGFDDAATWCLITEWESVGAYRRALGAYDVKLRGTPLLSRALPEASAFETLATAEPGGPVAVIASDLADTSGTEPVGRGPGGPIASRA